MMPALAESDLGRTAVATLKGLAAAQADTQADAQASAQGDTQG